MSKIDWKCDECNFSIAAGEGYVYASDFDAAEHVRGERDREFAERARREATGVIEAAPLSEIAQRPEPIRWEVRHTACFREPEQSGYTIPVEQLQEPGLLLETTAHLLEKSWTEGTDLRALLLRAASGLT